MSSRKNLFPICSAITLALVMAEAIGGYKVHFDPRFIFWALAIQSALGCIGVAVVDRTYFLAYILAGVLSLGWIATGVASGLGSGDWSTLRAMLGVVAFCLAATWLTLKIAYSTRTRQKIDRICYRDFA
jgi:hypothetical protein